MIRIPKHAYVVLFTASLSSLLGASLFAVSDPVEIAVREHVDLIEINHYFDDGGKPVFYQLIFYNWDEIGGRYNVVGWRLLKHETQVPQKNAATGLYYSSWHDGSTLRLVETDRVLQTWTQYDPETRERLFLPKERRADLLRNDLKRR